jgi:protoheme IX farnesyltransferase
MVTTNENISIGTAGKVKAYYELLKFRLSFLVAFSGAFGYSLAVERIDWERLILISLAGFLITGAANIVNQVKEIELDKLMKRTAGRPLPTGRLSVKEASIYCLILLLLSSYILFFEFNFKAGVIGVLSFILYGFVYTPLKRVGPISVFVGAISSMIGNHHLMEANAWNKSYAINLMMMWFGSFIYLPIVQIAFLMDKV